MTNYMDNDEAETAIGDHFSTLYKVHSVKCEEKVELKAGATFTCQLRFDGASESLTVAAHVTEVVNRRGKFQFKLVENIFDPTVLQKEIIDGVTAQTGATPTVDCGPPRRPKTGDTCDITSPTGEKGTVVLTASPDGKLERWALKTD